jgi:hypothetical protein
MNPTGPPGRFGSASSALWWQGLSGRFFDARRRRTLPISDGMTVLFDRVEDSAPKSG